MQFHTQLAKHVHAKFQTDLDIFLTIFEKKFRIFQEYSFANSKKILTWVCFFILNLAKHVHAKFQFSSFYPDGLRQIFDLFSRNIQDFLKVFKGILKFQNFESEVHQAGLNEACSPNFSFLAFNTAELAAPQISSKNLRQRRVTDGFFFFALNSLLSYTKSLNVKICDKKKLQVKPILSICGK
jgi:hypothetical protein